MHGILKDGSRITCDVFIQKTFASYVLPDVPVPSLKSDTSFFSMMGNDHTRMKFFTAFISSMREKNPAFETGCYVDSTPLPNDIDDNPFNALSCYGASSSSDQTGLVLVLDEGTGYPVWYDIISGNVMDINTIMNVVNDVASSLSIEIESLVLDAGYVSKELVQAFHIGSRKSIIGRMPARKGYPFKTLYWEVKPLIGKGKYAFVRNKHVYFGKRKEVEIFGHREYAYVYVDQNNALQRFRDYCLEHGDEYEAMKDRDKDWYTVKFGYFVLISNRKETPEQLLTEYFERTAIESVFKTSKEYLSLLPLSKWNSQTIRGKIPHDIIDTIILLQLRKCIAASGISISELTGRTQSLMCFRNKNGKVSVETPNRKVKDYYKLLGIDIPAQVNTEQFMKNALGI